MMQTTQDAMTIATMIPGLRIFGGGGVTVDEGLGDGVAVAVVVDTTTPGWSTCYHITVCFENTSTLQTNKYTTHRQVHYTQTSALYTNRYPTSKQVHHIQACYARGLLQRKMNNNRYK